ncbi:TetR/AcrR family transcriptional regulator [Nocardia sp. NPDC058658]|uniref:TetR/AcrR family transcriptional regulator n=1 Tax=Nocardia sp. NPDC058658 TaxID=3346580 RepID=UPI00365F93D9
MLDTVVDIVVARGFANTRFSDVSEASGVAVSTLQGYFGSREDMLVEALRRSTALEVAEMESMTAGLDDDPWARLVALTERGLGTPVPVWRMLMEFWTAAAHDDELREHAAGLAALYRRPFDEAVADGIAGGMFHCRRSATAIVDVAVGAMDGLLYPRVLGHMRTEPQEYTEVVLDQLAACLGVTR